MFDLQTVFLSDSLPINRVGFGEDQSTLRVYGRRLSGAERVLVDGFSITKIRPLSDEALDITLPDALVGKNIKSVEVISSRYSGAGTSKMYFEFGESVKASSGLQKLIIQFVSLLLTTPGSDVFHMTYGGGVQGLAGMLFNPDQPSTYTGPIMAAVTRSERQLLNSQISQRLPLDEKLKKVDVLGISFEPGTMSIAVSLGFQSQSGETGSVQLGLEDNS